MRFLFAAALAAQNPVMIDPVYAPGMISTDAADVRLAVRPDGQQEVWGSIGRGAAADQEDIWERHRVGGRWSSPARVTFNSDASEFDPAFSPDGQKLYFHSDRPGGMGGTDLYVVEVESARFGFGSPVNLGPYVNSAGDEWAPTPLPGGGLIFSSDGWGGLGLHDLFMGSTGQSGDAPVNLGPGVNGADEDFDSAVTPDGELLIFSSGRMSDAVARATLYSSSYDQGEWRPRRALETGCTGFVLGASLDPANPERLFYSANCDGGEGRMDIRAAVLRQPD